MLNHNDMVVSEYSVNASLAVVVIAWCHVVRAWRLKSARVWALLGFYLKLFDEVYKEKDARKKRINALSEDKKN